MGALATIQEGNKCTEETKAKDDVFLHQHIDEMLEFEYSNYDGPSILRKDLEIRFNNQRKVLLPYARDERNNLRFQDFKKVNEFTSALFRICQTLRFCGQTVTEGDMLEETFSIYHASNINLQEQYRLQNCKRYSDLNVNLLVAEKNNKLLMKNHQNHPTGSLVIPEENVVNNNDTKRSRSKRGRGDQNRKVPMNETFHEQTDDELTEKELKQVKADDQAIQTILFGLPEDIYAAVDSCETAQEIWLRVQQMMKGFDVGIQ
uniref:Putative zinc finger, CCHC-type n=1 Tax=Tanacetum cinerariifolium TaxID=118510 RepID=A0A6L2M9U0_TANCI|nr:putative zinc finger, CCHC-type [Tanacetum cinerariifolium]